jgi:hypothetical protein
LRAGAGVLARLAREQTDALDGLEQRGPLLLGDRRAERAGQQVDVPAQRGERIDRRHP